MTDFYLPADSDPALIVEAIKNCSYADGYNPAGIENAHIPAYTGDRAAHEEAFHALMTQHVKGQANGTHHGIQFARKVGEVTAEGGRPAAYLYLKALSAAIACRYSGKRIHMLDWDVLEEMLEEQSPPSMTKLGLQLSRRMHKGSSNADMSRRVSLPLVELKGLKEGREFAVMGFSALILTVKNSRVLSDAAHLARQAMPTLKTLANLLDVAALRVDLLAQPDDPRLQKAYQNISPDITQALGQLSGDVEEIDVISKPFRSPRSAGYAQHMLARLSRD